MPRGFATSRQSVAAKSRNCNYHADHALSLDERARLYPDLTYSHTYTETVLYLDTLAVTNEYDAKLARVIDRCGFALLVASPYAHLYYVVFVLEGAWKCTCGNAACKHVEAAQAFMRERTIHNMKTSHPEWFVPASRLVASSSSPTSLSSAIATGIASLRQQAMEVA